MSATAQSWSIKAQVHPNAINSVADFFNASTVDALSEVLQNARRSGATRIDIEENEDEEIITVRDNGSGISDPQDILSFGYSGWKSGQAEGEHPAGMGFYALARQSAVAVVSKRSGEPAWKVALEEAHFRGEKEARVETSELKSGQDQGTEVSFRGRINRAHQRLLRYHKTPTTLNGRLMPMEDYLERAIHIEEWKGLRIGVKEWGNSLGINFHGKEINDYEAREAIVEGIDMHWHADIDVIDAPELRLTLPAREKIVKEAFAAEMLQTCRRVIFQALAASEKPVDLPKKRVDEARAMGFSIPDARPRLKAWTPENAEYHKLETGTAQDLNKVQEPLVIDLGLMKPAEQQMVYYAAGLDGSIMNMFEADPRLAGYGWYDALPIARSADFEISAEGTRHGIEELRNMSDPPAKADTASVILKVEQEGKHTERRLETDVILVDEEEDYVGEVTVIPTRNCRLTPGELAEMMFDSYFQASHESESDSEETQRERAEEAYQYTATECLQSQDEALLETIKSVVVREVRYRLPPGCTVRINLRRGHNVEVAIEWDRDTETD